jgi:outer membrane exchange protein TraA
MSTRRIIAASVALFALLPGAAWAADPVSIPEPITPPLELEGTGLCAATARSTTPQTDFGNLTDVTYNSSMNKFMEDHKSDRSEYVIRTLLDLSNNNSGGLQQSYGDFKNAIPECAIGGCDFFKFPDPYDPYNDAWGIRARGFLNVTPEMAGKPIHFGAYVDDALSLTFWDKDSNTYNVLMQPPILFKNTWRMSNTVTFEKAGLYPVEILYAEGDDHAALELGYLIGGSFTDFANDEPSKTPNLYDAGFALFEPRRFFHTLSGEPSFPDPNQCQQCVRQFQPQPGNSGCVPGYYCNEAALCAPCDSAVFCGPTCSPCKGETPFCVNINGQKECGGCRDDFDCKVGFECDPIKHVCHECNDDNDCVKGDICVDHSCVPCANPDQCGGASCNCCGTGSNGKQMQCVPIPVKLGAECATSADCDEKNGFLCDTNLGRCVSSGPATCVECFSNEDCLNGLICDLYSGHCVTELKNNASPDCCGEGCAVCPPEFPFCLPGPVGTACAQCRHDMDCPIGEFCLSGECGACVRDKRCGLRCESCGGDTPYCLGSQIADNAFCVRCTNDSQCVGGKCDPETHACEPTCEATCAPDTPHCDGQKCVECYADTQCPCGGTCDLGTNTCNPSCKTNIDCLGNEHCRWKEDAVTKECALGPMPGDVACGGTLADACGGMSIGDKRREPPPAGLIALVMAALACRRYTGRRSTRGAK